MSSKKVWHGHVVDATGMIVDHAIDSMLVDSYDINWPLHAAICTYDAIRQSTGDDDSGNTCSWEWIMDDPQYRVFIDLDTSDIPLPEHLLAAARAMARALNTTNISWYN